MDPHLSRNELSWHLTDSERARHKCVYRFCDQGRAQYRALRFTTRKFHRQGSGVQQKNTAATAAAEIICLDSTQSLPTLPTVLLSSLTAVWDCGVLAAVVHVSCSRDEQHFFLTPHLQIFFTCQTCSLQLIMSHVTSLEDVYQTSHSSLSEEMLNSLQSC